MAIADGAPGPSPDEGSRRDTRGRILAGGGAMVRRLSLIAVARPPGARLGLIFDRGLELARVRSPRRKPGAATSSSADPVLTPIRSTTFQNRCAGNPATAQGDDGVAEFDARSGSMPYRKRRSGG
jgi:hypothetical protein